MKLSVNKEWVKKVSFTEFCKDANISKLTYDEQVALFEYESGKKVKSKKGGE